MHTPFSRTQPEHSSPRSPHVIRGAKAASAASRGACRPLFSAARFAALLCACALAACTMPTHPDSAAPPADPYNPAATQLLDDTQWELTRWADAGGQLRTIPHGDNGQPITLDFSTTGGQRRVSGFSGCNRYMGTYDLKDGKLSFGPLAGTRKACRGSAGAALEQPYLNGLQHIAKSGVQMTPPQQLQMTLDDGQVLMFTRRGK
jgi:heat shock protein HslJ